MNLKQLEAFVEVAESGSFSKAAKRLFLTQPTVSAHILALEKELESVLGRKICIQQGKNSGQLTLEYYGADDLERLTEALRALRV